MGKAEDLQKRLQSNIRESGKAVPAAPAAGTMPARREPTGEQKGVAHARDVLEIEVGRIIPDPDQPRKEFDEGAIDRMANSLLKHGQIMPIAVRWSPASDRYMIVAGERRWRGAMKAGVPALKAVVRKDAANSGDTLALQLIENLIRENLAPLDQANAYRRLMDLNGWSGARLAEELHVQQSSVVHALALLELPAAIQERVELEDLPATAAYELSKIADPVVQEELATRVVETGMKRDQVRAEVRKVTARAGGARNPGKGRGGKAPAKGNPKPLKPWKCKADNGARVSIEFAKGMGAEDGKVALIQALEKYRSEHAESVA